MVKKVRVGRVAEQALEDTQGSVSIYYHRVRSQERASWLKQSYCNAETKAGSGLCHFYLSL